MKATLKYIAAGLMLCTPAFSQAQDVTADTEGWQPQSETALPYYRFADNWFASIHVGINGPLGENVRPREYFKLKSHTPAVAISFGKYFVPQFGARVMFGYYRQTGFANYESRSIYPEIYGDGYFRFNNVNGFLDGILNLNNTFGKYKESRRFNASLFLGIGFNTTFGFDKDKVRDWAPGSEATKLRGQEYLDKYLPGMTPEQYDARFHELYKNYYGEEFEGFRNAGFYGPYPVKTANKTYLAVRAGFILSYKLNKHLDLEFEGHITATDDGYDGTRYNDKYDGYTVGLLGLKYHFLDYVGKRRFAYTTLTDQPSVDEVKARMREAEKELADAKSLVNKEYAQENFLEMTVNFIIDRYNITDIQRANVEATANYLKAHPEFDMEICGYADVQTAYPSYNMKLSKRRVTSVYNMLVHQFGVDPSRLSIDYRGDIDQPYARKNEWNRVVRFKLKRRDGAQTL